MLFSTNHLPKFTFRSFLGILIVLCWFIANASAKSACVEVCPKPQDLLECKAFIDIQTSLTANPTTHGVKVIYSSTPLSLEASVNFRRKCYESFGVRWTWSVMDDKRNLLHLPGISLHNSVLDIPPDTLDVGTYFFRVNASLMKPYECITMYPFQDYLELSNEVGIQVNVTKLIVTIPGGTKRRVYRYGRFAINITVQDPGGRVNMSDVVYALACDTLPNVVQTYGTVPWQYMLQQHVTEILPGSVKSTFISPDVKELILLQPRINLQFTPPKTTKIYGGIIPTKKPTPAPTTPPPTTPPPTTPPPTTPPPTTPPPTTPPPTTPPPTTPPPTTPPPTTPPPTTPPPTTPLPTTPPPTTPPPTTPPPTTPPPTTPPPTTPPPTTPPTTTPPPTTPPTTTPPPTTPPTTTPPPTTPPPTTPPPTTPPPTTPPPTTPPLLPPPTTPPPPSMPPTTHLTLKPSAAAPVTSRISLCRGLRHPISYSKDRSFPDIYPNNPYYFPPPDDQYVFIMHVIVPCGKYRQIVNRTQTIQFVNYETGVYDIVCEQNCNPAITIGHTVKLKAECSECLDSGFEWRMEAIHDNNQMSDISVRWKVDTEFGENHPLLVLHPGVLESHLPLQSVNFSLFTVDGDPIISKIIAVRKSAFSQPDQSCEVWPNEGWELVTEFTINCTGLTFDWTNVLYFEYGQRVKPAPGKKSNNIILRYTTLPWVSKVRLLAGDPNSDYTADLYVTLVEKYGVSSIIPLRVKVRPVCLNGGCIATKPECLFKLITDSKEGNNYFASLRRMGHYQNAIATAHVITHMLNRDDGLASTSQLAEIRLGLVKVAGPCTSVLLPSIKQVLYFIGSVFHMSNAMEILYGTQFHSLQVIDKCVEMLRSVRPGVTQGLTKRSHSQETIEYQDGEIKHLAKHTSRTLSDIFETFHTAHTITAPSNMTQPLLHFESILYSVSETLFKYIKVNVIGDVTYTDYFNLSIQKIKLLYLIGTRFGYMHGVSEVDQLGHFRIPEELKKQTAFVRTDVSVQLIQFKRNPLLLGMPNTYRYALPIFLFIRDLASNRQLTDQLGPIDIFLTYLGGGSSQYHGFRISTENFEDEDVNYYHMYLPPSNDSSQVMLSVSMLSPLHSLQVIMQEDFEPHVDDFSSTSTTKILTNDDALTMDKREDVAIYQRSASGTQSSLYCGILPTQATAKKLIKECKAKDKRPILLYASSAQMVNCLHYDYRRAEWTTKDCSLVTDGRTSTHQIQCRCISMSRFTGQSVTMTNTYAQRMDFFDFYLNVPFNLVIVIFLLILVILFALLLLLALYMDSLLSYKLGVTVIEDNDPEFTYSYLVSVSTSGDFGSGTTSVPAIQLHGEDGISSMHVLADRQRPLFRTANTDHFLVTTKNAIRNIKSMTLVQKPVKPTPSWNLHRIVVSDLVADGVWEFYVNDRLLCDSVDPIKRHYEGRPVPDGDQDKIISVTERIRKRFADEFIWTSIFLRSACSPFTSIQRAICVILLILLAFFINLLVRGLPEHTPAQHIGVHGFRVIMTDVALGLVTALILVIFVVIVVYVMKAFCTNRLWRVFIDLSNDWNEYAKKGLVLDRSAKRAATAGRRPSAVALAGTSAEKDQELDKKAKPPRPPETFLLKIHKTRRVFEINVEERPKKRWLPQRRSFPLPTATQSSIAEVKPTVKQESVTTTEPQKPPAQPETTGYFYCTGRGCVWLFLVAVIVILVVLLYVLGHWYSETQTLLWIFSSLVGILFCVLLLHPLVVLFLAICLPLKNTSDKDNLRKVGLSSIFDKRQALIREKGTLEEFRQYLNYLRQQPIYNPKATDKRNKQLAGGTPAAKERRLEGVKAKTPEGVGTKAPEGVGGARTPEGVGTKAPEGVGGARTPEGVGTKAPEGVGGAKRPEGVGTKAPEGVGGAKTPEGVGTKAPEGVGGAKTPEGVGTKATEGIGGTNAPEKRVVKTPEKGGIRPSEGGGVEIPERGGVKPPEEGKEKGLEGEKQKTSKGPKEKAEEGVQEKDFYG